MAEPIVENAGILWQNGSGKIVTWEMDGTSAIGTASLANPASLPAALAEAIRAGWAADS